MNNIEKKKQKQNKNNTNKNGSKNLEMKNILIIKLKDTIIKDTGF